MYSLINLISQLFNGITPWVVIAPWEQAVRVRLGKHIKLLESGIHLRLPFIDRVAIQSVRMRLNCLGRQVLTDGTGQTLTISATIGYSITDLLLLYQTLHDADGTIQNIAQAAVAEYVAKSNLKNLSPAAIETGVNKSISLEKFGLGNINFHVVEFSRCKTYRLVGDYAPFAGGEGLRMNTFTDSSPRV